MSLLLTEEAPLLVFKFLLRFLLRTVPHRKVKRGVLLKRSLVLEVLKLHNFFLDLVFLWDVGDRRWLM